MLRKYSLLFYLVPLCITGCFQPTNEKSVQNVITPIPVVLGHLQLNETQLSRVIPDTKWVTNIETLDEWNKHIVQNSVAFEHVRFQEESDESWQLRQSIMQYENEERAVKDLSRLRKWTLLRDINFDIVPWVQPEDLPPLNTDNLAVRCERYRIGSPQCAVFLQYHSVVIRLVTDIGIRKGDISKEQLYDILKIIDELAKPIWNTE